jgi:hypothetical protein
MVREPDSEVAVLVALLVATAPGWHDTTRDEIRSGNAASQAAVAALQARVEVVMTYNRSHLPPGAAPTRLADKYVIDYSRSGDKERIQEINGPLGVRDIIRDAANEKASVFAPKRDRKSVDSLVVSGYMNAFALQIWQWTLFELPECKQTLSQLLAEGEVKSQRRIADVGHALIFLSIRDSKGRRYEIWVDPSANYLIRKLICHTSKPKAEIRIEGEVVSFQEVKPGVFFPARLVHSIISNGTWLEKAEATLTEIRINESMPEGQFQHTLPVGTWVTDNERGTWHTIGPDGQPTKSVPIAPSSPPIPLGTGSPLTAEDHGWPWHRFVLICSVIIFSVALGAIIWKRRKSSTAV